MSRLLLVVALAAFAIVCVVADGPAVVVPVLDGQGSASYAPRANLTRYNVKPVIDTWLVHDAELAQEHHHHRHHRHHHRANRTHHLARRHQAEQEHFAHLHAESDADVLAAAHHVDHHVHHRKHHSSSLDQAWQPADGSSATVAASAPASAAFVPSAASVSAHFDAWVAKHKYIFRNSTHKAHALNNYAKNHAIVAKRNAKGEGAGQHSTEGPFGHLSAAEFKQIYLTATPTIAEGAQQQLSIADQYEPQGDEVLLEASSELEAGATYDWRSISTPIKNQGSCGACWAFAATEALESAWRKAGHALEVLSPQQLVDCNHGGNNGCNGGNANNAIAYWQSHGSATAASYKYTGKAGTCRQASGSGPRAKTAGYVAQGQEKSLPAALAKYGPLMVMVDASHLQHYSSGVLAPKSGCSSASNAGNHFVVIVAYSPSGKYWVVRNSWGTAWGEKGYFRLAYGHNTCGVVNWPSYVTA